MLKFELRCEICHSKFDSNYNIPKVLICGHTVCSKCVDRMKEKNISRCPFDRRLIDFDDDKVANNYYILSLIDGSIKESVNNIEPEVEEIFELSPKPVVNNPGWKNTLDGFIKGDILYTIESNGFFYCTDLKTGEWWFLYLNQFWGKHYFQLPESNKMYMIDQYGNLFQIFTKNYYTQIGKKNAWRNTTHFCVLNDKLYSVETSDKFYETNLENGKWKEIGAKKNLVDSDEEKEENDSDNQNESNDEENISNTNVNNNLPSPNLNNTVSNSVAVSENAPTLLNFNIAGINFKIPNIFKHFTDLNLNKSEILPSDSNILLTTNKKINLNPYYNIKDATMLISNDKNLIISNKKGELFLLNETTGETVLMRNDFSKTIDTYFNNKTHLYFIEKSGSTVFRVFIGNEDFNIYNNNENGINGFLDNININELSLCNRNKEFNKKLECDKKTFKIKYEVNNTLMMNIMNKKLLEIEVFIELDKSVSPIKIFADDNKLVITDKKGELVTFEIDNQIPKKFQCLFMLRNCHLHNTILVGDGDLLILDPIRLSLNKLNIITGSEVIILHSLKFLSTIKYIFSNNTKIYFIDITGSLFHFLEADKKIAQIGNNGVCKYLLDYAVSKNYLFTIEHVSLYRTSLTDGNCLEIKNEFTSNYKFFFADNLNLVFITRDDEILIVKPEDATKLKKKFYYPNISKMAAVTFFKQHIIFYNTEKKTIEALNLDKESNIKIENVSSGMRSEEIKEIEQVEKKEIVDLEKTDEEGFCKVMIENFPEVSLFINNNDCLACIIKDGFIYKLFC